MTEHRDFVPYESQAISQSPEDASREFYEMMRKRRSVRMFSNKPVSRETIENIIAMWETFRNQPKRG